MPTFSSLREEPYGVAGLTQSGRDVGIAMPEHILAGHEALAETLKLMPGFRGLQQDKVSDSVEVINMENGFRDFHGLPHRSGRDHQNYPNRTVITLREQ
jgi:hypothetical protein